NPTDRHFSSWSVIRSFRLATCICELKASLLSAFFLQKIIAITGCSNVTKAIEPENLTVTVSVASFAALTLFLAQVQVFAQGVNLLSKLQNVLGKSVLQELMDDENSGKQLYPIFNLIPRRETEVEEFWNKHPTYDGRGVLIAVLDTGVDPSTPGMQTTSDGRTKVVDIVDFTGAGDVDTSTVRQAENGFLIGLTGRKLRIPNSWKNPSGKYHLGVKAIYELYPQELKRRVQDDQKKKQWDPIHRLAVADVNKQVELFELEHGRDKSKMTLNTRLKRKNLDSGLKLLKALDSSYDDCGPTADCIVFNDGTNWVKTNLHWVLSKLYCFIVRFVFSACLDTSFCGELSNCKLMASYRIRNEYATITETDMMTYSFNIHDNGMMLEIVCTAGLHGTHVACIAAGCFPEAPHRNGVAPGAQIVSLQIGDSRLKNLETGTALLRAITYCIEKQVHIINYSYAEPVSYHNSGQIIEAINDAVYNHGIVFIGSSGNNGPCLSTVTSPGGSCSACLGVSAYLAPQMRTKLYSLRESIGPMLFPWSSRGPCSDGWLGTTICAPGAAITSTPRWTLNNRQLLSGTSMSSPNAAGAVALLISGLKMENVSYSPFSIRLALANTAKKVDQCTVFEAGRGNTFQTEQAFKYLLRCSKLLDMNMRYKVALEDGSRGVYLRESYEVQQPCEVVVFVEAAFNESTQPCVRFQFSRLLALKCDAEWVRIPTHLEINSAPRSFRLRVDPTRLEPDRVHYAEVLVYEADKPILGPVICIPITVIIPMQPKEGANDKLSFTNVLLSVSGCRRHFIHIPKGCNTVVLQIEGKKCERDSRLVIQLVQLMPDESYRYAEWYKLVRFGDETKFTFNIPVIEGRTAELCIASWWMASDELVVDYKITFCGLRANPETISWHSNEPLFKVMAICGPSSEELHPTMSFRSLCVPLKPTKSLITNLGPRDLYNDGRQCYQVLNTYEFSVDFSTTVTPMIPLVSDYLYEAQFCGFLWTIYSKHDRYLMSGSYFSQRYQVKLEKGDYKLILQVRHVDEESLIDLKDLGIFIECRLNANIQAHCYASFVDALGANSKKFSCRRVPAHSVTPLYFVGPSKDSMPKSFKAGSYLRGSLVLQKHDVKNCQQFPVQHHLPFKRVAKSKKKTLFAANEWNESIKSDSLIKEAIDMLKNTKINDKKEIANADLCNEANKVDKEISKVIRALSSLIYAFFAGQTEKTEKHVWDCAIRISQLVKIQDLLQFSGANDDCLPVVSQITEDVERKKNALTIALLARGIIIADSLLKASAEQPIDLNFDSWKFENSATGKEASPAESVASANDGESGKSNCGNKEEANNENVCIEESLEEMPNGEIVGLKKSSFKLADLDEVFIALVKLGEPIDGSCAILFLKHAYLHGNLFHAMCIVRKYAETHGYAKRLAEIEIEVSLQRHRYVAHCKIPAGRSACSFSTLPTSALAALSLYDSACTVLTTSLSKLLLRRKMDSFSLLNGRQPENAAPVVYAKASKREPTESELDPDVLDPFDAREVFDLIRSISDPEHPLTLEELNIVSESNVHVDDQQGKVEVYFTPTIPHCSMSMLIGLCIRAKLARTLPSRFKYDVIVTPGSHREEQQITKQLADKERVAAALERTNILEDVFALTPRTSSLFVAAGNCVSSWQRIFPLLCLIADGKKDDYAIRLTIKFILTMPLSVVLGSPQSFPNRQSDTDSVSSVLDTTNPLGNEKEARPELLFFAMVNRLHEEMARSCCSEQLNEETLESLFEQLEALKRSGRKLAKEDPSLNSQIDAQIELIKRSFNEVSELHRKAMNNGKRALISGIMSSLLQVRTWLTLVEYKLDSLVVCPPNCWTAEELERQLESRALLQKEIEENGRLLFSVVHKELEENSTDSSRVKRLLSCLQRRWYAVWLKSLEMICRCEDLLKNGILSMSAMSDSFEFQPSSMKRFRLDDVATGLHLAVDDEIISPDVGYSSGNSARSMHTLDSADEFAENFDNYLTTCMTWPKTRKPSNRSSSSGAPLTLNNGRGLKFSCSSPIVSPRKGSLWRGRNRNCYFPPTCSDTSACDEFFVCPGAADLTFPNTMPDIAEPNGLPTSAFKEWLSINEWSALEESADLREPNMATTVPIGLRRSVWLSLQRLRSLSRMHNRKLLHLNYAFAGGDTMSKSIAPCCPTFASDERCAKSVGRGKRPYDVLEPPSFYGSMPSDLTRESLTKWKMNYYYSILNDSANEEVKWASESCSFPDLSGEVDSGSPTLRHRNPCLPIDSSEASLQSNMEGQEKEQQDLLLSNFADFICRLSTRLSDVQQLLNSTAAAEPLNTGDRQTVFKALSSFIYVFSSRVSEFEPNFIRSGRRMHTLIEALYDWLKALSAFCHQSVGEPSIRYPVEVMTNEVVDLVRYLKRLLSPPYEDFSSCAFPQQAAAADGGLDNEDIMANLHMLELIIEEAKSLRNFCLVESVSPSLLPNGHCVDEELSFLSAQSDAEEGEEEVLTASNLESRGSWFWRVLSSMWPLQASFVLLAWFGFYMLEPPQCCSDHEVWESSFASHLCYINGLPPT
ncbi:hypothetical protein M514_08018, partial [Trichuris suis]